METLKHIAITPWLHKELKLRKKELKKRQMTRPIHEIIEIEYCKATGKESPNFF